jgi:hypothetical protein
MPKLSSIVSFLVASTICFAQPLIAPHWIVNGANFMTRGLSAGSIAQGSLFTIFGVRLGLSSSPLALVSARDPRWVVFREDHAGHDIGAGDPGVRECGADQRHHAVERAAWKGVRAAQLFGARLNDRRVGRRSRWPSARENRVSRT